MALRCGWLPQEPLLQRPIWDAARCLEYTDQHLRTVSSLLKPSAAPLLELLQHAQASCRTYRPGGRDPDGTRHSCFGALAAMHHRCRCHARQGQAGAHCNGRVCSLTGNTCMPAWLPPQEPLQQHPVRDAAGVVERHDNQPSCFVRRLLAPWTATGHAGRAAGCSAPLLDACCCGL
jgi:hypothetical protein